MSKSVDVAVFPISTSGRRLFPLTYGIPKDLLPLGRRSLLHIAMAEAAEAGIREFVLVFPQRALFSPFAGRPGLKTEIRQESDYAPVQEGIEEWLSLLERIVAVVPQRVDMAGGLAGAIASVERLMDRKSFAVLLADDAILETQGGLPRLVNIWKKRNEWIVGLTEIDSASFPEFGVVEAERREDNTYLIRSAVEKPRPTGAGSGIGIVGRYVFDFRIFELIKETEEKVMAEPTTTGFHVTEAINLLAREGCVTGVMVDGPYYHVGTMKGYLDAWNHLAALGRL